MEARAEARMHARMDARMVARAEQVRRADRHLREAKDVMADLTHWQTNQTKRKPSKTLRYFSSLFFEQTVSVYYLAQAPNVLSPPSFPKLSSHVLSFLRDMYIQFIYKYIRSYVSNFQ
jgi:hypothetical protein